MARTTRWTLWAAAAVTLMGAAACNDSQSPRPRALLGLPDVGTLAVTVTTSGSNTPSGYTVIVDGSSSQSVGATGVATFLGLPSGSHTVLLSRVPSNCSLSGDNPRTVSLIAGLVAATTFSVSCTAPPTTGSLRVTTATSGASGDVDPDGYSVTLDGTTSRAIGDNATTTFSGLAPGSHTVVLSGVAANGTVSGGTSRTLSVTAGTTVSTSYAVSCAPTGPTTGSLSVTTATSGASGDVDPDGYSVTLDGTTSRAIGDNATTTFSGLAPGSHTVVLSGVAANCTVSGGTSRTLSVTAGSTVSTSYAVSCAPTGPTTGSLSVTTATSGASGDVDPDGYSVTLDGTTSRAIGDNATTTFSGLAPGSHTVVLSGVAANCTVSGGTSRTLSVTAGSTVSTSYAVSCAPTGPTTGSLSVTTATSGASGDVDPDGYSVTLDGTTSRAIGDNATTTFSGLAPGSHTVVLSGVAANCTVSGGTSRTLSVTAGSTVSTSYAVSCAPTGPTTGSLSVTTATSGASGDVDPDGYSVTLDGTTSRAIGDNATTTFSGLAPGSHTVVLSGVAANCTVSGGTSRTLSVTAGSTVSTSYAVSCAPTGPTTGSLSVTTATSGASGDVDPDGYSVTLDGTTSRAIGDNATTTFSGLAPGSHTVVLSGVAANCTVSGGTSRTLSVTAGSTVSTSYAVSCAPTGPTTGSLSVTTATSGASGDVDPDGYSVTLDGTTSRAIGDNATTTFSGLAPGSHTVVLSGVAANCTVSGGTSRTLSVTAGSTVSTSYAVSCAPTGPTTGSLSVTTATSGASGDVDPDGYSVTLDGTTSRAIGDNATTTFSGLAPGSHTVVLSGVAANCTVSGGTSRTLSVTAGSTVSTSYAVSCAPTGPTTGSLSVTTATSGASGDVDPDGYSVTLDGTTSRAIGDNATTTFSGLAPGSHTVVLSGVAANCTVSGGTSRTLSVTAGSTVSTSYAVSCAPTGPTTGSLSVTTATSGASGDVDPDGYSVTLDGTTSRAIGDNATTTFSGLAPGSHTVVLSGVAANCTVSGGTSRTLSVTAGSTVSTSYAVSCAPTGPTTGSLSVTTATSGASGDVDPDGYSVTLDGTTSRAIGDNATTTFTGLAPGSHTVVLSGVAANCTVSGGTSRTLSVTAGSTVSTSYAVSCAPTGPTTGSLSVTTATSGASGDVDPDGYSVTLDGTTSRAIGDNATTTFTGLAPGSHTVVLSGVAANCTVSGGTSRTLSVTAGSTVSTSYAVSCAPTGPTSGASGDLDPDGYTVSVDGGAASQPIPDNGSVTFTGPAGDHTVALSGVAGNCSVSGANPRTVTVPSGGTVSTMFSVSCAPTGGGTGSLTVTTSTTGSNLDPDGYTITIDGSFSQPIGTNASVTFTGPSGDHTLALSGVASNCSVSG